MPTKNRRIATYLPKHIDDRLESFKSERSIKGDSQALIIILSEFLEVSQEVAHQSSSANLEIQRRVEGLEERIAQLKDELLSELLSELRTELQERQDGSIKQVKAEVKDELLGELKSESSKIEPVPGQLELISESDKTKSTEEMPPTSLVNGAALAKQLKVGESTLRSWKAKGNDFLLERTRAINNGVGWIYLTETKQYQLEKSVPSDSLEAQKSELPNL